MSKIRKLPYSRVRDHSDPSPEFNVRTTKIRQLVNGTVTPTIINDSRVIPCQPGYIMTDVVTPGYKILSSEGKLINNPMSKVTSRYEVDPWSGQYYTSLNSSQSLGPTAVRRDDNYYLGLLPSLGQPFPAPPVMDLPGLAQDAINGAISNAHQRNVMGIVDLMELDKTGALLLQNVRRLESLIRRVPLRKLGRVKGRKGSNMRVQKYTARTPAGVAADALGLHLEVQYGVIPLMLTIEGLMKTFSKQTLPPRQTFRGFKNGRDNSVAMVRSQFYAWTGAPCGFNEYVTESEVKVEARAGIITDYKPSIQAMLGLEVRDIPTAAYELIKFSFVLDWIFDLGSYIEAVTPVKGFNDLASWITITKELNVKYQWRYTGGSVTSGTTVVSTYFPFDCSYTIGTITKTRTPSIHAGLPSIDLNFRSPTHLVSAIALAVSSARKSGTLRI